MDEPQAGLPTYYKRRTPEDSELDPDKPLRDQFNLLRVADNDQYPAFFRHLGHKYVLKIEKVGK
jgi:methionyl-tRNA formyltransferase